MKKFKNKSILITGGTGSFGSTFLKKIIKNNIFKNVTIFSRDEKKQYDLRNKYNDLSNIKFIIGDVRDYNSVYNVTKGIDYIFHAAALKQVPTCEFHPEEALKTNTIGSSNVAMAAIENKIKKCVFLSTDKAVEPINVMGMTKSLMEKIVLSHSKIRNSKTKFSITRYGNVMMSRGSVIPLFVDCIKNNKNLTITDENMTRFIMSLEESISLVLYALNSNNSNLLYVYLAKAVKIMNIIKALELIFKKKLKIEKIGIRKGEKIHEVLLTKDEMARSKIVKNYAIINDDAFDYKKYFYKGSMHQKFEKYDSNRNCNITVNQMKNILLKNSEFKKLIQKN